MQNLIPSLEVETHLELHPPSRTIALFGLAAFYLTAVSANFFLKLDQALLAGIVVVYSLGVAIICTARSLRYLAVGGFISMNAPAAAYSLIAAASSHPALWFFAICMALTMPVADMHYSVRHCLFNAVPVWVISFIVIRPDFGSGFESAIAFVVSIQVLLVGCVMCRKAIGMREERVRLKREVHALAFFDALTGLPNRRAFLLQLDEASHRGANTSLYFFMIDVDNFKSVNDDLGHDVGDEALVRVANAIKTISKAHAYGRLGGEEFSVSAQFDDERAMHAFAQSLVDAVNTCEIKGRILSVSVGVSRFQQDDSRESFLKRADTAMYKAKLEGKNRYVLAQ